MASEVLIAQIPSRRPNTPTPDSDEGQQGGTADLHLRERT